MADTREEVSTAVAGVLQEPQIGDTLYSGKEGCRFPVITTIYVRCS